MSASHDEKRSTDEELKEKETIIEEKEKLIEEKEESIQGYLNQMKKMQADFINFKKRAEKEKIEVVTHSNRELIGILLDVLDNLERAAENGDEGITLIYKQFRGILEKEGLEEIDTSRTFDPYYHEVVAVEDADCEEDTITEVFQKGYLLKNKVLRHTKVKICKR